MDLKNLNKLYDGIIELQRELEGMVALSDGGWYSDVKALAATYELQDYLASAIAKFSESDESE